MRVRERGCGEWGNESGERQGVRVGKERVGREKLCEWGERGCESGDREDVRVGSRGERV